MLAIKRVHSTSFMLAVALGVATLFFLDTKTSQAPAEAKDLLPPKRLELIPNPVSPPTQPVDIEIGGVPPGETVDLKILWDCYEEPDLHGESQCMSSLERGETGKAVVVDGETIITDHVNFRVLEDKAKKKIPAGTALWLRASRRDLKSAAWVMFGLGSDPCSLWQTLIQTFGRGKGCQLGLSLQAIRKDRGSRSRQATQLFEVRRLYVNNDPLEPIPVPGTLGATGVAWVDSDTLLVTIGDVPKSANTKDHEGRQGKRKIPNPGLWSISVRTGVAHLLWAQPSGAGRQPSAPIVLPDGSIAFIRQSQGEEPVVGEEPAAFLSVLQKGGSDPKLEVPLPYKVHQLLASDAQGLSIIALTLGVGAERPALLQIDLMGRSVRYLGFHPALYHMFLRAPTGTNSVVAFEDNSGQTGWDIALVDSKGALVRDLQVRPEDDLLPAWSPSDEEIAFIAEANTRESPD